MAVARAATAAERRAEAFAGFDVVVENGWARGKDHVEQFLAALEVGRQHLDAGVGQTGAHGGNGAREVAGALVRQVVALHAGDDDVAQGHAGGGLGHALGLVRFDRLGAKGLDGAELAGARTAVAEDHEGGAALVPALAQVRAARALTDGVQPQVLHEAADVGAVAAGVDLDADPLGQTRTGELGERGGHGGDP